MISMGKEFSIIGKRVPLADANEKVTGRLRYGVDVSLSGMLHAKVLRSPYAHARIVKIETSKAESLPGVEAVIMHKNVPLEQWRDVGGNYQGRVLDERVRFYGDEVAAVAAKDKYVAEEALNLIEVEYEELPHVFDVEEAMKPGAPQVLRDGNVRPPAIVEWGDIEKGFMEADLVVEHKNTMGTQQHAPVGCNACLAQWQGDKLTIWTSTQTPFDLRDEMARFLKMPQNKVRVVALPTAMSQGLWYSNNFHFIAVLLAKKAGKPVKLELTQEESFATVTRRHTPVSWGKLGVKKDGTFIAIHVKLFYDNGAYCVKPDPHEACSETWGGRTPHGKFEMYGVSTNLVTASAMRGVGDVPVVFLVEQLIDEAAERLRIDPVAIRLKNHIRAGEPLRHTLPPFYEALGLPHPTELLSSCGLEDCIKKGTEVIGWKQRWKGWGQPVAVNGPKRRGLGMGVCGKTCAVRGMGSPSVIVKVNRDGSIHLLTGVGRMGQGSETTQAQIVAEELGVPVESIVGTHGDTETCPWTFATVASVGAHMVGLATQAAAADAKRQLCELAGGRLGVEAEDLDIKNGIIHVKGQPEKGISIASVVSQNMASLAAYAHSTGASVADVLSKIKPEHLPPPSIIGRGSKNIPPSLTAMSFEAHFVEVEVDTETGEVKILRYVVVRDSGTIINPEVVENQVTGGVTAGSGLGVVESLIFDGETGRVLNPNFQDYKILTALDMPDPEITFVEVTDPVGAFGIKGAGEGSIVCPVPAIAQAIHNAIGVRLDYAPITPDIVLRAWKSNVANKEGE